MGDEDDHENHSHGCCDDDGCHASKCETAASGQAESPAQLEGSSSDEEETGDSEEEDGSDSDQADLVFPAVYGPAVAQLLNAHSQPVKVKAIKLDGDEVKLDLAVTMWKEGILSVRPDLSKGKSGKKLKQ